MGYSGYWQANWRKMLFALVVLLGLLVVALLVRTQYAADQKRDEALRLQSHTYEVIIRAHALSGSIGRAEAELGRYVISGEKLLGQRYSEDWRKSGAQIDRLAEAASDSTTQAGNIAELRAAWRSRGEELDEAASYSVARRNMDALGRFYQLRESPALHRLDAAVERVITHEHRQLLDRTHDAQVSLRRSTAATQLLAGFGLLLVVAAGILGWLTVQAIGQRLTANAEAEAERERAAELQRAVDEATRQLRHEAHERLEAEAKLRQVQKMEAVGQLTGGIAHDFNNMLAVALGGMELALRHLRSGKDAQKHIENAMEGANRAAALTRRLLTFARADALTPEGVEAGALIRGMSDLLDRTLGETIAVVTFDAGLHWQIWADRHQLENALLNLAVNARDAMDGNGTITISSSGISLLQHAIGECPPGDYVTIAVTDTGTGMAPDVLERVFEPFFTTKPAGRGTGLGLSQIFGFVRQSGGEIAIDSEPGRGTTVTLYLPRHITSAPVQAIRDDADTAPAAADLEILVVEDDPRVLMATLAALRELGHRPTGLNDPLEAPDALSRMARVDLILSDVLMPGQSGPEMVTTLGERIQGVPILFVTGYAGEALEATPMEGRPVLRKPFTLAALSRAITEAVQ